MMKAMSERLICIECGRASDAHAQHWQAHLVDLDDDGHDEFVLYCPACAVREFGFPRRLGESSGAK